MKARFTPQPDITAYELAIIWSRISMGLGTTIHVGGVQWPPPKDFPESCLRHFTPEPSKD